MNTLRQKQRGECRRSPGFAALFLLIAMALAWSSPARGQDLEPRAYVNLPTGLNFLVAIYSYSEGGLATDPALPVDDAHLKLNAGIFAYARSMNFWGCSGKVDMVVPYAGLSGNAIVAGQYRERNVDGFLDPRFRVAINFYGAPALELKDFAKYKPGLVFGGSLQVTPPLGQYDSSKLINLGTNRWTFDPDIGFSKKIGHVTFDATIGATLVTENHDYYNGQTLAQDPIYSSQFNLSYDFGHGIWAALGYTYYWGGQTSINGASKNTELSNSRAGLTVALPINRNYSLKFNYSSGVSTRTGTSFDTASIGLQYRWGGGL